MGTVDDLHDLDPESARTTSQQIANALRAAILLGVFDSDERLPSQHQLADRYGVARETVKSALRILHGDRLIVSRQGSGVFVRRRAGSTETLTEILRAGFDRPHVTIDYAGFNGETLANTLTPCLQELATGRLTAETLRLRMLLVDPSILPGMPRQTDPGHGDPVADADIRTVFGAILDRSVGTLSRQIEDLEGRRIVRSARIDVRVHGLGPSMKLYLVNGERAFFGFYPVTTATYALSPDRPETELHHPSGWDATLFTDTDGQSTTTGPTSSGPPFTAQAQDWFDSVWSTIARDYPAPDERGGA